MPGVGGLSIANNLLANNIGLNLDNNQAKLKNLSTQLSSGLRINTSADDASGYAISTTLQNQVNGFDQASQNVQDVTNAVTVANGALTSTTNILSRLRTLAVEAASDVVSQSDRNNIQVEITQLTAEVNQIASSTNFNGINLLDGTHSGATASQLATLTIQANAFVTGGLALVSATISSASTTTADGSYEIQVVAGSYATSTAPNIIVSYISSQGNAGTQVTLAVGAGVGLSIAVALSAGLGTIYVNSATFSDIGSVAFIKETQFVASTNYATSSVLTFQDGASEGQVAQVGILNASAVALRINNLNVSSSTSATYNTLASEDAIGQIDNATVLVLQTQANLGAVVNRLQVAGDNDNIAAVNLQASESAIRDLNVAQASSQYTSAQILVQAGSSLLAASEYSMPNPCLDSSANPSQSHRFNTVSRPERPAYAGLSFYVSPRGWKSSQSAVGYLTLCRYGKRAVWSLCTRRDGMAHTTNHGGIPCQE